MPTSLPTLRAGGRHRKPKAPGPALRRAAVVAVAAPVAGTILACPSAFATEKSGTGATVLNPTERKIAANLNSRAQDARLGGLSGVVIDAESGRTVWGHDATTALMPASTTKLATATAALKVLGSDHRFTTKVVHAAGTLTLVGGGDRTLTTGDLTELARTAASGLLDAGVASVKVQVDDSLFPSPTLATGWNNGYYPDSVAPVRDLVVNGRHVTDTSLDAGQTFAQLLAEQGVTANGAVTRGVAGSGDTTDSSCAVGRVKAKTGTLTGAIGLSGLTKAEDGHWKIFSFIENDSPAAPGAVKDALDGLAATVNGCWAE
ncbi:D-alanyl-D-alanine carboxypeptidase / D-alanyl-D-alanine-endopeptidase (penicillin-binding protein 4) [Streptomyces sp. DI166]|uniref:D-alanyl-D-alanine carboxypeptidase n=1 Tax=Streptomyces sp. DI166 TaxID=1839783 RepID=UPI0007F382FB|nr:D-alanyl-D-alanine carboxypeptidase [Streptomyces sp. DI166]SBT94708.1 D-alanyl-D-alanine carboxypeptidase / D-alanyl-D-alanine-endopeptidase (penicillin-binding protein 4) [Streptomyces sp. DI166]